MVVTTTAIFKYIKQLFWADTAESLTDASWKQWTIMRFWQVYKDAVHFYEGMKNHLCDVACIFAWKICFYFIINVYFGRYTSLQTVSN